MKNYVTKNGWVRATVSDIDLAERFSVYLADNCDFELEDFGGGYPWEADLPHEARWQEEVEKLNKHLAELWGK